MLVLNAAMLGTLGPVAQIDGKEFGKVLTLNLLAQQALIAAFDPMLRRSEAGRVLAVTSSVGAAPRAYWGAYGASKAALETLVARLWPGGRQRHRHPGRDRRSRRHRHADARPRLSGRGSGDAEGARARWPTRSPALLKRDFESGLPAGTYSIGKFEPSSAVIARAGPAPQVFASSAGRLIAATWSACSTRPNSCASSPLMP